MSEAGPKAPSFLPTCDPDFFDVPIDKIISKKYSDEIFNKCNIWDGTFPEKNSLQDGWLGTSPVDYYDPNSLDIYDTAGNVWEWCSDWYHDDYFLISENSNPKGPEYGTEKVCRGGSWFSNDIYCTPSRRYKLNPDYKDTNFGFRCVKDL